MEAAAVAALTPENVAGRAQAISPAQFNHTLDCGAAAASADSWRGGASDLRRSVQLSGAGRRIVLGTRALFEEEASNTDPNFSKLKSNSYSLCSHYWLHSTQLFESTGFWVLPGTFVQVL